MLPSLCSIAALLLQHLFAMAFNIKKMCAKLRVCLNFPLKKSLSAPFDFIFGLFLCIFSSHSSLYSHLQSISVISLTRVFLTLSDMMYTKPKRGKSVTLTSLTRVFKALGIATVALTLVVWVRYVIHGHMPYMKLLSVRPNVCRRLLSDSNSQWSPCHWPDGSRYQDLPGTCTR